MDQVSQVREKIDLVSLISEYIPLKRAGRNFKTNCPFHGEKTPSFVVSPERQIWHCFGCQKGGDCFSFLMEYESLEFPEALRLLAKKAHIELKTTSFDSGLSSKKEQMYKLNHLASEFYHFILTKHRAGWKAIDYLKNTRGIQPKVIETFMLGYAPMGSSLCEYLMKKKGYKKEELLDAGLATQRSTGLFDFFGNRVMFPLFDHRDNVLGFSGRTMDPAVQDSKYINTRETLVYHKGSVFFGLNTAKAEIKKEDKALIMEGEFDVISSFQAGFGNAVAIKGSALTDDQVNLIARFTKHVGLCFDADDAGQAALKRSIPALEKKGITTTVIVVKDAKDPDEAIKKSEIDFKKAVKEAEGVYDYLFSKTLSQFNKKTAEGKKKIADELLPFIALIENEIVKEHYLKKLAKELDSSYESVSKQIDKAARKEPISVQKQADKDKRTRKEIIEEYLLCLIIQDKNPKKIIEQILTSIPLISFSVPSYQKLFDLIVRSIRNSDSFDITAFSKTLPQELVPAFNFCYLYPFSKFEDEIKSGQEVEKILLELSDFYHRQDIIQKGNESVVK